MRTWFFKHASSATEGVELRVEDLAAALPEISGYDKAFPHFPMGGTGSGVTTASNNVAAMLARRGVAMGNDRRRRVFYAA